MARRPVRRLTEAARDLDDAVDWYDDQFGKGPELLAEVEELVERVAAMPTAFPAVPSVPEVQFARLKRYPYRVIFVVQGEDVVVIALAHEKRDPGRWLDRVP